MKHSIYPLFLLAFSSFAQGPDSPGTYVAKEYKTAHNGVSHIVYQQRFLGIEVYGAAWTVNTDADGKILNSGGTLYPDPGTISLPSQTTAFDAVRAAVRAVNPKLAARYTPLLSSKTASKGLRFAAVSLGEDIDADLVWYPIRGTLQPAWKFEITDEDGVNSYTTIIESATQMLLHKLPSNYFFQSAKGLVFERESPQPNATPGVRLSSAPPYVNRSIQPFPAAWIASNQTVGNNTTTGENLLGTSFLADPIVTTSPGLDFNFPLELGPGAAASTLYRDAVNTNLFYWVNRAHDLHYQSGFDEASGNFQNDNFGKGGVGGDPILAYTHFGAQALQRASTNNAFFSRRSNQDGSPSMIAMYIGSTGVGGFLTDGALDANVIVHEYTHGVSSRLAKDVYSTFQGAAMGEAWSDFFGLEFTTPMGGPAMGSYTAAEYLFQAWGAGIRTRPFSTDMEINPLTFAHLGQVISFPEVHADGEIWMEALWEARANLIAQFGEAEGRRRIRLLVLDGMKLMPPQGTMVDARDGILLADRVDFKGTSQSQLWAAFAKRGLGALAYTSGGNTAHVHPAFTVPANTGQLAFYDDGFTIGEAVRIVLSDSNNYQKSALVQVTSASGDLENVLMTRNGNGSGSAFIGTLPSSSGASARQNGVIGVIPGDGITAYYLDIDSGSGASQLVTQSASFTPGYALTGLAPRFSFSNEREISSLSDQIRVDIPFAFPFFDQQYRSMNVHVNGLLSFGLPVNYRLPCTDAASLSGFAGIAPLWSNLNLPQSSTQGIFVSYPTPKSMTIRWALETFTQFANGKPVNFAVTLTDEGLIQFQYGAGNTDVGLALTATGCGPAPVTGISSGRDTYTQRIAFPGYENMAAQYEPPFNSPSLPIVIVETPKAGDKVNSIMTLTGIAYDPKTTVSRVDILIDGINRGRATTGVTRTDYCAVNNVAGCPRVGFTANLDLKTLGVTPGQHTLALRVTNIRGGYQQFPESPIPFEMELGDVRLPYGKIEAPTAGTEVSGMVTIAGYAFADDLRILSVDTLIDGVTYGPTAYGLARTDICNTLPTPRPLNCPSPGFRYQFNSQTVAPALPNGRHSMQIRVRDELGRFTLIPDTPVDFTVKNDPLETPVAVLTTPKANDVLTGTVNISGYAYTATGRIASVTLLLDGTSFAAVPFGQPRPEACAALPVVTACPNIGFSLDLDTRRIVNGPHILGLRIVNDKGAIAIIPATNRAGLNVQIQN